MWKDPIIEELHQIRAAHAKQFNYDMWAIYEDLKAKEMTSDWNKVNRSRSRSPVAIAKSDFRATNWLAARQQLDGPMTCKAVDRYVIMSSTDHKNRKPISVGTTLIGRNGEWLVGYNRLKENTGIVGIDGKEYRDERYYCLCTTHPLQPWR